MTYHCCSKWIPLGVFLLFNQANRNDDPAIKKKWSQTIIKAPDLKIIILILQYTFQKQIFTADAYHKLQRPG